MKDYIEPWKIKNDRVIVNSENTVLAEFPVDYEEDAARTVECVNALADVLSPGKILQELRKIIEDQRKELEKLRSSASYETLIHSVDMQPSSTTLRLKEVTWEEANNLPNGSLFYVQDYPEFQSEIYGKVKQGDVKKYTSKSLKYYILDSSPDPLEMLEELVRNVSRGGIRTELSHTFPYIKLSLKTCERDNNVIFRACAGNNFIEPIITAYSHAKGLYPNAKWRY